MNSLVCTLTTATDLSAEDIDAWRTLQKNDFKLQGPYFSPEFALAVGQARSDLEVAIWRANDKIKAVLPFHRMGQVGKPIAGPMSDYHAIIGDTDRQLDATRILKDCGLQAFDFRHWLSDRTPENAHIWSGGPAAYLDVSKGFDAFCQQRRDAGVSEVKKTLKKKRKLEREIGPIRFIAESDDPELLAAMMSWKSLQYHRSNITDIFEIDWVVKLLKDIHLRKTPHFSGALSAIYAGEDLIAVHFGMRTDSVWHYWYPTHNDEFSRYSPGMILALEVARHAAENGFQRIDLGLGSTRFKHAFGSAAIEVAGGYLANPSSQGMLRHGRHWCETSAERLPIGTFSRWPQRLFKRIERRTEWRY